MRSCGILMPIFSLPSPYGIGTFGKEAFRFIDFLSKAGQRYWQILPLNPTNYGDSPYQSFSSFAGNPYFIDLDLLIEEGLLLKSEVESIDFGENEAEVDYGLLYENRLSVLKTAFSRFKETDEYLAFKEKNAYWLYDYALFMAIKNANGDEPWYKWEEALKVRKPEKINLVKEELKYEIEFYCFIQFKFDEQWLALKKYATEKGIEIIGDIPIYVALDSADVWANPKQFLLDKKLNPKKVAGVPPDLFSDKGQLWGNPIYDWKYMEKDNFSWWKSYLGKALERYDVVRIDHFRGFEAYYAIPFGHETAENGKWVKGPDMKLFDAFKAQFGEKLPIIAEDLGVLTPAVEKMLKNTGFPGMKVLQFAFGEGDSDYLPHNFEKNCVVYTGTHDNDTIIGWLSSASKAEVEKAKKYLNHQNDEGFNWAMIKAAMGSVADICIIMMNDVIGADSDARINTPSVLGGNWKWRIKGDNINDWLASLLLENTLVYGRTTDNSKK